MTTILKSAENLENQVQTKNYNVTYDDITEVFKRIKNKGILNEPIILDGHAKYKNDMQILHSGNKRVNNKKRLKRRDEELEL